MTVATILSCFSTYPPDLYTNQQALKDKQGGEFSAELHSVTMLDSVSYTLRMCRAHTVLELPYNNISILTNICNQNEAQASLLL